jgi:hypothetical protein
MCPTGIAAMEREGSKLENEQKRSSFFGFEI